MAGLVIKRLSQGIIVLLLLSALIFFLFSALGGDALSLQETDPQVSPEIVKQWRHMYGLDRPFPERYKAWLLNALRGELGQSVLYNRPVSEIIWPRLKRTISMALLAVIIALIIAMTLGIAAARYPKSWISHLSNVIILLGSSTPRLIISLVILSLIVRLSWYDVTGMSEDQLFSEWVARIIPPATALSLPVVAIFLAQVGEGIGGALKNDYVRTARAKGLSETAIILRHVIRPALSPLITVLGYTLGSIMSGAVIVEKVLHWPGLGELSVDAVKYRDIPLLMGIIMVTVTSIICGNLFSDILLRLNDPRLREK